MEKEAIKNIQEWLHKSTAYLSTRSEYARGYKNGIEQAKVIVADLLRDAGVDEKFPNHCNEITNPNLLCHEHKLNQKYEQP